MASLASAASSSAWPPIAATNNSTDAPSSSAASSSSSISSPTRTVAAPPAVARIHHAEVGRRLVLSDVETIHVDFHNFVRLLRTTRNGEYVKSPIVHAHGQDWLVLLFPGGRAQLSGYEEGNVSASLRIVNAPQEGIKVMARVRLMEQPQQTSSSSSSSKSKRSPMTGPWTELTLDEIRSMTFLNLAQRDEILVHGLDNGTLTMKIDLQIWKPAEVGTKTITTTPGRPSKQQQRGSSTASQDSLRADIASLLVTGKCSDVTFVLGTGARGEVGGDDDGSEGGGTVRIAAHKTILAARCPPLYQMVMDSSATTTTTTTVNAADAKKKGVVRNKAVAAATTTTTIVRLQGVSSLVFQYILRYIYSDEMPSTSMILSYARLLLEAADRFGCTHLKDHIEAEIVSHSSTHTGGNTSSSTSAVVAALSTSSAAAVQHSNNFLNTETAAEWLFFADQHSCRHLKQAALRIFTSFPNEVMASAGWNRTVKASPELLTLLLQASHAQQHNNTATELTEVYELSETTSTADYNLGGVGGDDDDDDDDDEDDEDAEEERQTRAPAPPARSEGMTTAGTSSGMSSPGGSSTSTTAEELSARVSSLTRRYQASRQRHLQQQQQQAAGSSTTMSVSDDEDESQATQDLNNKKNGESPSTALMI